MFKAAERLLVRWFSKATKYNSKLVDSNHVGLRLDQYLKAHGVKWSSLQRSLRNRYYYVRGQDDAMVRDAGYRLKQEDEVFYPHNSELHQYFEFQATNGDEANFFKLPREQAMSEIKSMTIFENDHLIVLNKKAGYATQGGQDYERNLFTLLISCYDRSAVHIMHRLDLPCSGVVMFAKSSQAARLIQPAITGRDSFHKFYLAKVIGQPNPSSGLIDCNIEWNNNKKRARLSSPTIKDSQTALTYYKTIESNGDNSLCLVKLLTGRKHQIRCHLSQYVQTPIVNDTLYGSARNESESQGIQLHSYALVITRQDIIDVFQGKQMTNASGTVSNINGNLWITATLPWKVDEIPIDHERILRKARKLLDYTPGTSTKRKFVAY